MSPGDLERISDLAKVIEQRKDRAGVLIKAIWFQKPSLSCMHRSPGLHVHCVCYHGVPLCPCMRDVGFPGGSGKNLSSWVKNQPVTQETQVSSLGQEDPLEKRMATPSSILTQIITWAEEPGGLLSMGLKELAMTKHAHMGKASERS